MLEMIMVFPVVPFLAQSSPTHTSSLGIIAVVLMAWNLMISDQPASPGLAHKCPDCWISLPGHEG